MHFCVSSLANHATDERKKEEATAGKCHDSSIVLSVNMIIVDVSVMGLHHC